MPRLIVFELHHLGDAVMALPFLRGAAEHFREHGFRDVWNVEGGIDAWLTLGQAVGLEREAVTSLSQVLPGVRFAVDAYINFARRAPWQEAVCSSLTELFAPEIHKERLANWPQHYPWIDQAGYAYFRKRLSEARRDVEHGVRVSLDYFQTRAQQARALEILQFKLDILWSMLDAMQIAYGIGPERTGAGTPMPQ